MLAESGVHYEESRSGLPMKARCLIAELGLSAAILCCQTAHFDQPDPGYTEEARAAGLEGTVLIKLDVGRDGMPANPRIEGPPLGLGLDEKAMEAAQKWRFAALEPAMPEESKVVAIDFLLPSKFSRWHLVGASFETSEGASRPTFLTESYPRGPGVSDKGMDEALLVAAMRRVATVKLQFDVDEHGIPRDFQVLAASEKVWGGEAIAVVGKWRFRPAMKDGNPLPARCTLDLAWVGPRNTTKESLARMRAAMGLIDPALVPERTPTKIKSIQQIEDDNPRSPYSVIVSVTIGEDGVPIVGKLIRSIAPEYEAAAIDAVRKSRFAPAVVNGTALPLPALIEVDF